MLNHFLALPCFADDGAADPVGVQLVGGARVVPRARAPRAAAAGRGGDAPAPLHGRRGAPAPPLPAAAAARPRRPPRRHGPRRRRRRPPG